MICSPFCSHNYTTRSFEVISHLFVHMTPHLGSYPYSISPPRCIVHGQAKSVMKSILQALSKTGGELFSRDMAFYVLERFDFDFKGIGKGFWTNTKLSWKKTASKLRCEGGWQRRRALESWKNFALMEAMSTEN